MRIKSKHFPCLETPMRCYLTCTWNQKHLSSDQNSCVWMTEEKDKWCEWYLLPVANTEAEAFYIQSVHTNYFLCISDERGEIVASKYLKDTWVVDKQPSPCGAYIIIHEKNGEPLGGGISSQSMIMRHGKETNEKQSEKMRSVWSLEMISGELCFISCPDFENSLIGSDLAGRIYTTGNFGGWEVWRFTEIGDGLVRISSYIHNSRALYSDETGLVYTTYKDSSVLLGGQDKWKIQKAPPEFHGVTIQSSFTGNFLQLSSGQLKTVDNMHGSSCIWHLSAANRNQYYLHSIFSRNNISTNKSDPFMKGLLSRDVPWTVQWLPDESFSFFSERYDRYLGSDDEGNVTVSKNIQDYEKWDLEETDDGYFLIISKKHRRYLTCLKYNKLMTIDAIDEGANPGCKWNLEISLPFAPSRKQIASFAGATILGFVVPIPILRPVLFGMTYTMTKEIRSTGQLNIDGDNVLEEFQMNRPLCAWETWSE